MKVPRECSNVYTDKLAKDVLLKDVLWTRYHGDIEFYNHGDIEFYILVAVNLMVFSFTHLLCMFICTFS